jgi:hypothetical protein
MSRSLCCRIEQDFLLLLPCGKRVSCFVHSYVFIVQHRYQPLGILAVFMEIFISRIFTACYFGFLSDLILPEWNLPFLLVLSPGFDLIQVYYTLNAPESDVCFMLPFYLLLSSFCSYISYFFRRHDLFHHIFCI